MIDPCKFVFKVDFEITGNVIIKNKGGAEYLVIGIIIVIVFFDIPGSQFVIARPWSQTLLPRCNILKIV